MCKTFVLNYVLFELVFLNNWYYKLDIQKCLINGKDSQKD
jgi:hypothetical protein